MLFRRINHPHFSLTLAVLLVLASAVRVQAGGFERQPSPKRASVPPRSVPFLKIVDEPYLIAVGPQRLRIKPLEGPRVRRAPALPAPKHEEGSSVGAKAAASVESAAAAPHQPSAFSAEAPPVLLPQEAAPQTEEPSRKEEPKESVLAPSAQREPDLRDSVIYFSTPTAPAGSRIILPATAPNTAPVPAALPESRAVYRKEKE